MPEQAYASPRHGHPCLLARAVSTTRVPATFPYWSPNDGAQLGPAIEPLMINSQILPCPQKRQKEQSANRNSWKSRRIKSNKGQKTTFKVRHNSRVCGTAWLADQAIIKHIWEGLLSQKYLSTMMVTERKERVIKKRAQKRKRTVSLLSILGLILVMRIRRGGPGGWNRAVTLSVSWSESESLSHLSPGNHSSLSALSGHYTNHSQASWD